MRKLLLIFIIFSITGVYSQMPTFRIHPSDTNQIEPSIAVHPLNPQILFTSAYTIKNSFRSEGIYVSTNGGNTWYGLDKCPGGFVTTHGGDPGPIIDKNGVFILTHQGGISTGMFSNYSTDFGVTWSGTIQIASGDQDKGSPATDDIPSSPFYGRTYLAWSRFTSPFPAVVSYTTNSGLNWSGMIQVNISFTGHVSLGTSMTVGPNGEVYLAWAAALQNSPSNEDYIGFGKSTNGGISWSAIEQAYDVNGIKTANLLPWSIRVNSYPMIEADKSGGPRNGWIYIVTTGKNLAPAGSDPDVLMHRSTDNGATWSSGVRVNQDPINNGEIQYFPVIKVDEGGGVNIVYYDTRNSPGDSVGVYYSRSTDGGTTWSDQRINDHWFYPKAVAGSGGGNQGDNIGIAESNGKLIPTWMSNVTGVYQVFAAMIDIPNGIKKIHDNLPEHFSLKQNYPNPFNPVTKIRFEVASTTLPERAGSNRMISLVIYNSAGQEIESLVNESLKAGEYEAEWNAKNYPSGIYYYQLTTGEYKETRKMILMK